MGTPRPLSLALPPRPWQLAALAEWERSRLRGVVRVVTGAGKTIFAELCMQRFAELVPDSQFTIIVPTHALLDQWYVSLREDFGLTSSDIAVVPGKASRESTGVMLAVLNSARKGLGIKTAARPAMLIVDECHKAGSPANARALHGAYAATLGLSATPEREYDDGFVRHVVPALGGVVFDYDFNDARKDGVIVPFSLVNVRVPMLPDEEREYAKFTRAIILASKRGTGEHVERLLQRRARVAALASFRLPVAVRLVEEHRGSRCLVFHEQIDRAEKLLALLKHRGHSVTIYHSGLSSDVRYDNLRQFRRGIVDVLVCCRALDEGVNVPEASVAIIASATASNRQRIQRLGRVLRPAANKPTAVVYTLYVSGPEEQRLRAESFRITTAELIEWTSVERPASA